MTPELDEGDPGVVYVDRAIKALVAEFAGDEQVPRFVCVVEYPPAGRVGIASTGEDGIDTHRMLTLGAAAIRSAMSPTERRRARDHWQLMKAGFEARN